MRLLRVAAVLLVLIFTISGSVVAGPSKSKPAKPAKIKVHAQGEVFCPAAALVIGATVIAPRRCYLIYVVRDNGGTFLAFADPAAKIPPGQLVRLGTPAGAKLRGRIFYVVPIRTTAAIVPVNSMTLVAFRAEDYGPRLTLVLTSMHTPNLSITFVVRL